MTKILLFLVGLLFLFPQEGNSSANILLYHRFGEDNKPSTSVTLEQFEAHLQELKWGGYALWPLDALIDHLRSKQQIPDKTVVLTVDDAFISTYTVAWPLLKQYNIPLALFVVTDMLDMNAPAYMTWDQVRELSQAGVIIGTQLASHPHMPLLSLEENQKEIQKSKQRIKEEIGKSPVFLAYPYGEYSADIRKLAEKEGFLAAFGQHSGSVSLSGNLFEIPRFSMNMHYSTLNRLKLVANAQSIEIVSFLPSNPVLSSATSVIEIVFLSPPSYIQEKLNCYLSSKPISLEWLTKTHVRLSPPPFPKGRTRLSCTYPSATTPVRWHWLGAQFIRY